MVPNPDTLVRQGSSPLGGLDFELRKGHIPGTGHAKPGEPCGIRRKGKGMVFASDLNGQLAA